MINEIEGETIENHLKLLFDNLDRLIEKERHLIKLQDKYGNDSSQQFMEVKQHRIDAAIELERYKLIIQAKIVDHLSYLIDLLEKK